MGSGGDPVADPAPAARRGRCRQRRGRAGRPRPLGRLGRALRRRPALDRAGPRPLPASVASPLRQDRGRLGCRHRRGPPPAYQPCDHARDAPAHAGARICPLRPPAPGPLHRHRGPAPRRPVHRHPGLEHGAACRRHRAGQHHRHHRGRHAPGPSASSAPMPGAAAVSTRWSSSSSWSPTSAAR